MPAPAPPSAPHPTPARSSLRARWNRTPVGLRLTILGVLGLALLISLARFATTTPLAHRLVEARLEALNVRGQSLEIDGLDGDLLGAFTISRLRVRDADGVWFTGEDAAVSWSPFALLRGRLVVREVALDVAHVDRRPILAPSSGRNAERGRDTGGPVSSVSLGAAEVRRLTLAEGVAGPRADYRLAGDLRTRLPDAAASFTLEPLGRTVELVGEPVADQAADQVWADLAWGGPDGLTGDMELVGQPGGLISTLIGAPEGDAIGANLTARGASGTARDWTLTAHADIGQRPVLQVTAARDADGLTASARVDASMTAPTRALADRLGGPARLDLVLAPELWRGPARLTVQSPNAALDARGRVTRGASESDAGPDVDWSLTDVTARLTLTDAATVTGVDGLDAETLTLTGDVALAAGVATLDARLETPRLDWNAWGGRGLAMAAAGTLGAGDDRLGLEFGADAVTGLPDALSPLAQAPVRARATFTARDAAGARRSSGPALAGEVSVSDLQVNGSGLKLTGAGALGPILEIGAPELGEPKAGQALDVAGTLALDAAIWPAGLDAGWRLRGSETGGAAATLDIDGLAALGNLNPELKALVGAQAEVRLTAARRADAALEVTQLTVRGGHLTAEARGQLTPEGAEISASAAVTEAPMEAGDRTSTQASVPPQLGPLTLGDTRATLTLSGPTSALTGVATLNSDWLSVGGERVSAASGRADLNLALEAQTAQLVLEGKTRGNPARLEARIAHADARWRISDLVAASGDVRLAGEAEGPLSGASLQTVSARLSGALAEGAALDAALSVGALTADVSARDVRLGALDVARANMALTGTWPDYRLTGDLDAALTSFGVTSPLTVQPHVRLDLAAQEAQGSFTGALGGAPVATTRPIMLAFGPAPRLDADVSGLGGRITLVANAGSQAESTPASARLVLSALDLAQLGPLVARPALRGVASGEVDLNTMGDALEGEGALRLTDLGRGDADTPRAALDLNLTLAPDLATLTAHARDADGSLDLTGALTAPVRVSTARRSAAFDTERPAQLTLTGGGEIAPLWSFAAPPDMRAEGEISLNLEARGAINALRPQGHARWRGGLFEDSQTGLLVRDVTLDAALTPRGVEVERLTASGARGGGLSGSGAYTYDGTGEVRVAFDRLDALSRQDLTAVISGPLAVRRTLGPGAARTTAIDGDLTADEIRVDLSHLPRGGYETLDVTFASDTLPGAAPPETDPAAQEEGGVRLNVGVTADRRVFVTGAGVDSEWSLDARVTGSPDAPRLAGQAELVRGQATLIGRAFTLGEGLITFNGAPDDTRVALEANRTGDGITATVRVDGPVSRPDIAFSSSPDLPQDEVLSRVLFGRSAAQLSPLQAAQLASAAAALASGRGGALDLTAPLQAAIGVDRLDFGLDDAGAATVSTGKYLTSDIYLEVETGATGAPGVAVEWTPRANVEVGADIDPEVGPRLAVQWKRDFGAPQPAPSSGPSPGPTPAPSPSETGVTP